MPLPKRNAARTATTELILEVFRLNGRLLAAGDALVADLGLTSARWQVLGAVALAPVPLPVAHLARNMGLARQSVQRLVSEMIDDGLVRYVSNPHHRRANLVLLTERGETVYKAATAKQALWADDLAAHLMPESIHAATSIVRSLRRQLEERAAADERSEHDLQRKEGHNHAGVPRNG